MATVAKTRRTLRPDSTAAKEALDRLAGLLDAEDPGGTTFVVRRPQINAKEIREKLGLSQREFAVRFGISVRTLRNWEQGKRDPDGPAKAYLAVIKNDPEAVEKALAVERPVIEFAD